jgi:transposase
MPARSYRSYSTEFKLSAVHSYLNGEGGLKAIARQFGICHPLLILWTRKFQRGELNEELAQEDRARDYEAKIANLERKIGQLVMEVDLLKKGALTRPNGEPLSIVSGPQASPSQKDAA